MNKIRVIGVTGPSGAGKSLFSATLAKKGLPVIDADKLYHSLLVPPSRCLDAIRSSFGDSVFSPDGTLDRAALGTIVFSDPEKLKLLNSTVLGIVLERIREIIAELGKAGEKAVIVDAPTLIESGFHKECDLVISVLCPADVRIERISERDGISRERAEARVNAQKPDSFYIDASHRTLTNSSSPAEFEGKALELALELELI